jgi:hypothetical protein
MDALMGTNQLSDRLRLGEFVSVQFYVSTPCFTFLFHVSDTTHHTAMHLVLTTPKHALS